MPGIELVAVGFGGQERVAALEEGEEGDVEQRQRYSRARRRRRDYEEGLDAAVVGSPSTAPASKRCSFECDIPTVLVHRLAGSEFGSRGSGHAPDRKSHIHHTTTADLNATATTVSSLEQPHCQPVIPSPPNAQEPNHYSFLDDQEEDWVGRDPDPGSERVGFFSSEAHPYSATAIHHRSRTVSLDLNGLEGGTALLSPNFLSNSVGVVNKSLVVVSDHSKLGTFGSLGTAKYGRHGVQAVCYQQGSASERVPSVSNKPRYMSSGSRMPHPFSSRRALPSKWEDAERWIFSPVSSDGVEKVRPTNHGNYGRPKSKSGPLGQLAPGVQQLQASPSLAFYNSGRAGKLPPNSPFLAGVLIPEHRCLDSRIDQKGGGHFVAGDGDYNGRRMPSYSGYGGSGLVSSASIHTWADSSLESSSSLASSWDNTQDEKIDILRDTISAVSPVVVRKDAATQTSPVGSSLSSPKEMHSRSPSFHKVDDLDTHLSKLEIKGVQVVDRDTPAGWKKNRVMKGSDKCHTDIVAWKKTGDANASSWEVIKTAKHLSQFEGEKAKIAAWDNLQKARAEAVIQNLMIKIEKKRSSPLEKLFSKLRNSQRRTQETRGSASVGKDKHAAGKTKRVAPPQKHSQISSLSGCFTCHAF